ncbi:alanine racemase [Nocardioides sp. B-3]|uniref:alanine racemase n=1 Tax=Nocardioides sp. B-3 TaxID=2895565 RepID=UPI0021523C05|nr:alanine racemase [Nocardioides sp. B-3]UUZ61118.1 alanine racemase [Nocardioides sp. B-3]
MSLVLSVDGERWRKHLIETTTALPGSCPSRRATATASATPGSRVAAPGLDEQAETTGTRIEMMAVGTYLELPQVADRYPGDLLVLTPRRPLGAALDVPETLSPRVVHTVSRIADVRDLLERAPDARFVLEQLTSMRRHGMTRRELLEAAKVPGERTLSGLAGVAMHLPLNTASHLGEVTRLINDVVATGLPTRTIFVSHLTRGELAGLRTSYPDFTIRPRIGTDLWLGDRAALKVRATVLDVHAIERGETFGYRGRSMPKGGHIPVVSGGTAHGIGLEAPSGDQSLRSRAATIARSGMDVVGPVRSPFSIDGKQRLFAEPPHMQASMLFLPSGARVPAVGEDIDVRVRFTATTFDRVDVG